MSLAATEFEAETVTDDEFVNATDELETDSDPPSEEPEPTETEEVTDGPARDEQGRFAKKDDGESEEQTATSEAASETPEVVAEPAPETPTEPEDPGEPFTFRVSQKDYTLEGAKLFKDGLYVPTEQVENAKRAIAEGTYYRQNWQTLERQATDKGYQRALAEAPEIQQAKAMMAQLEPLLADPDAAANFLSDFHTNAPVLRANAMRAMAEAELERLRNGNKQQEESGQRERLQQDRHNTLSETMKELRAVPDTKVLTPEDWQSIDRQVGRLNQRNALFVTLENGPQGPGEYLDIPAIEEIAMDVLNARKQIAESAKKAEEALKFNAANRPKPNGKPASAAVAPRKGGAPKPAEPKRDSRDVVNDFLSAKLDFDD